MRYDLVASKKNEEGKYVRDFDLVGGRCELKQGKKAQYISVGVRTLKDIKAGSWINFSLFPREDDQGKNTRR